MLMNNTRKLQLDASIAGPLFMLSSALLFTALNMIIKLIDPAFTVWHIGFFRFFGGTIVLLLLFGRKSNPYRANKTRLLIIRGCTGSVAFISLVTAIRLLPVSTALVIFYCFPAFSAVASFFIFGERLHKLEIVCMVIAICGVGVLLDFQLGAGFWGKIFALLAGVCAGLTVTLIRTLRQHNGPVVIYLYFCAMGSLITLPMFAIDPLLPSTAVGWVMVIGIVLTSVSAQLLMNQGFFYCRGWEGGVFMSSEVIFTAIMGIVFLHDPVSWKFWTGGAMILGSVVALNRLNADRQKNNKSPSCQA